MSSLLDLATAAEAEITICNFEFQDRLERLLAGLRAFRVIPAQRNQLTYPQHQRLAAVVLLAMDGRDVIDRDRYDDTQLIVHGLPTQSIKFLDRAVAYDLLRLVENSYVPTHALEALVPTMEADHVC